MDISSRAPYPANELSNFAAHPFCYDGETSASMEGFLQSLKFEDNDEAERVRWLAGDAAKAAGATRDLWRDTQTLWWKARPLARDGFDYQALLDGAFLALYTQNVRARAALLATHHAHLTHELGLDDPTRTVLTRSEFCARLLALRCELRRRPWHRSRTH